MLKIGYFSKLCHTTVKTLRYYDEIDLLKPDYINGENGYRYYSPAKISRVIQIQTLKELEFTLAEIAEILSYTSTALNDRLREKYNEKKKAIQCKIRAAETSLIKLDNLLKNLDRGIQMEKVQIKELPEVIVASYRSIVAAYNDLHQLAPEVGKKMERQGAVCKEPAYCFNIYHDNEYKEKDIDIEICEAVVDFCNDGEGVVYKSIDKVEKAACIYHHGMYENLGDTYAVIFKWIEDNNLEIDGLARESYIDGCWNKENVDEWLTEIQIPLV